MLLLTSANGLSAVLGFGASVMVARALGPAQLGAFTAALTWMAVMAVLANLGLDTATTRFGAQYYSGDPPRARALFSAALMLRVGVTCVLCAFVLPASGWVAQRFLPVAGMSLIAMATLGGCVRSLWNGMVAHLRACRQFGRLAVLTPLPNILKIVAVWVLLILLGHRTVQPAFGIYVSAPLCCVLPALFLFHPRLERVRRTPDLSALVRLALLTLATQALSVVNAKLDIFMLTRYCSETDIGHYGAAMQLALALEIVSGALDSYVLPHVSTLPDREAVVAYLRRVAPRAAVVILALAGICVAPFWRPVITFVLGDSYGPSVLPFQLLLAAQGLVLVATVVYPVLYPLNRPEVLTHLSVVRLPISWVLYRLAVPGRGAVGAALATLLARIAGFLLTVTCIVSILRKRRP